MNDEQKQDAVPETPAAETSIPDTDAPIETHTAKVGTTFDKASVITCMKCHVEKPKEEFYKRCDGFIRKICKAREKIKRTAYYDNVRTKAQAAQAKKEEKKAAKSKETVETTTPAEPTPTPEA